GLALQGRFRGGEDQVPLVPARGEKALALGPTSGRVIFGKLDDGKTVPQARGQEVRRIMVLMPALECRRPQLRDTLRRQRPLDARERKRKVGLERARRHLLKARGYYPEQLGGGLRLRPPGRDKGLVMPALPRPEQLALGHAGGEIEGEHVLAAEGLPTRRDATADHLVVRVGDEDENAGGGRHGREVPMRRWRRPLASAEGGPPRAHPPRKANAARHSDGRRAPCAGGAGGRASNGRSPPPRRRSPHPGA